MHVLHATENRRSDWLWVGGLCVFALGVWIGFRLYTGIVIEDAWITYRYAKNLALGNGFVYNIGERVLGTTSPLFTIMLALLAKIFGVNSLPTLSNMLMIPAGLGTGVLTYFTLRKLNLSHWLPVFFLAVFFLHFNTLWTIVGGLETPLVMLLMAASFSSLVTKRLLWAAAWAALLVLTRIDGVIWATGIYFLIVLEDRRAIWKALLIGLIIVGPWVAFAFWYFGSPIPNTVIAKAAIGQSDDFSSGYTMLSYLGWVLLNLSRVSPFGRVAGFLFFFLGGWAAWRHYRSRFLVFLFLFPFAFSLAYYLGHAPKFPWYLIPVGWSALIIGIIGIWEAGRILRSSLPESLLTPGRIRAALIAFFAVYALALLNRDVTTTTFHQRWQDEENHVRVRLGTWLKDNTPTDATVLMEAVGYQGYFSERRIVDLAGLISPQVVKWHGESQSNAETFYKILQHEQPEYVVLRSYEADENKHFFGGYLFDNDVQRREFESHYKEVKRFTPTESADVKWIFRLTIFERTDSTNTEHT